MVLICIYGFLMVSGLTANLLVSFVVARRPQMHTPRNLYIVNLTVSDMTLCLICMPFTLVGILGRQWSLGLTLCKLVPLIQGTNIMVSVGTITVIALDRLVKRGSLVYCIVRYACKAVGSKSTKLQSLFFQPTSESVFVYRS